MSIKVENMPSKKELQLFIDNIKHRYDIEASIVKKTNLPKTYLAGHNGKHAAYFDVLSEFDYMINGEEVEDDD